MVGHTCKVILLGGRSISRVDQHLLSASGRRPLSSYDQVECLDPLLPRPAQTEVAQNLKGKKEDIWNF